MTELTVFQQKILDLLPNVELKINEPMSKHTSFRIGGSARLFALPETVEQLAALVAFATENELKGTAIGNGSNLLVSDKGFKGTIIEISNNMKFGLKMHEVLEFLDFKNPDYSLIEDSFIENKIKKLKSNVMYFFKSINPP